MFDFDIPFFLPLWRRIAVVVVTLGWTMVEISTGAIVWAMIFGAAGIYCVYALLFHFDEEKALSRIEKDKR